MQCQDPKQQALEIQALIKSCKEEVKQMELKKNQEELKRRQLKQFTDELEDQIASLKDKMKK